MEQYIPQFVGAVLALAVVAAAWGLLAPSKKKEEEKKYEEKKEGEKKPELSQPTPVN